jgi:hypothetical protein
MFRAPTAESRASFLEADHMERNAQAIQVDDEKKPLTYAPDQKASLSVRVLPTEEGEKCADFLGGSAQMSQSQ